MQFEQRQIGGHFESAPDSWSDPTEGHLEFVDRLIHDFHLILVISGSRKWRVHGGPLCPRLGFGAGVTHGGNLSE